MIRCYREFTTPAEGFKTKWLRPPAIWAAERVSCLCEDEGMLHPFWLRPTSVFTVCPACMGKWGKMSHFLLGFMMVKLWRMTHHDMIFVMLVWLLTNALAQDFFLTELFHRFNPRTAGGPSHLRTAGVRATFARPGVRATFTRPGGRMTAPPPENSKTKKDSNKR